MKALGIPDYVSNIDGRYACAGVTILLAVLFRFSYPSRLLDMERVFGIPHERLCRIVAYGVEIIYQKFKDRLPFDRNLIRSRCQLYSTKIWAKCMGALAMCIGFVDGTLMDHCRPSEGQEAIFNGHDRVHGLKFQSVTLPDGMMGSLFGPVAGRRHDSTVMYLSNVVGILKTEFPGMCIYGDMAYALSPALMTPYKGIVSEEQKQWNNWMKHVRISVEWSFGSLLNHWAHLDFPNQQKVFLSPTAKHFLVCGALTNMLNCLYPNQCSQYFELAPPTLEQYCNDQY